MDSADEVSQRVHECGGTVTAGLGGQVLDGSEETPYGRAGRPADPRGGRFSVIEVG
ncbi:hypothetical protein OTB20_35580 [Streptomyces sp. H27-H1]|uniref:hypothetical protein n=1 Tax=Streptomyces sp. H27-H1 TaxID=2996461 RepID=UPI00226EBC49|nr:hypothetical protein [Streptomyces sp. H27-H1]MCY0931414.1 hypothetical protein [Streptomyces sp. H27-H1]